MNYQLLYFLLLFSPILIFLLYKTIYDIGGLYRRDVRSFFKGKGCTDIVLSRIEYEDIDDNFPNEWKNYGMKAPLFPIRFVKVKFIDTNGERKKVIVRVRSWYLKKPEILVRDLTR